MDRLDAELMHTGDERLISAYQRQYVHAAVYPQAGRPRAVEPAFSIAARGGILDAGELANRHAHPAEVAPAAGGTRGGHGSKRPLPT